MQRWSALKCSSMKIMQCHNRASKSTRKPTHRTLPELMPCDKVRIREDNKWGRKGEVASKGEKPCSCHIIVKSGEILRSNRRDITKTGEQFNVQSESECSLSDDEISIEGGIAGRTVQSPRRNVCPGVEDVPENRHLESMRTRSGRVVRMPNHLAEYDMS